VALPAAFGLATVFVLGFETLVFVLVTFFFTLVVFGIVKI
jgi:hypothetical protein